MERYVETFRFHDLHSSKGNTYCLHSIVSLLAFVCIVSVCCEIQSLVHGPGMSIAAERICARALLTSCNTSPLFLEKSFECLLSSSFCEVVLAGRDWTENEFVWDRLSNERLRPGKSPSVPVRANNPERMLRFRSTYVEFPSLP